MQNNKVDFIELCKTEKNIPIFMQPHWLDAVCTEGVTWDVLLEHDANGNVKSFFIYCIKNKWGIRCIIMSYLTKYLGLGFTSFFKNDDNNSEQSVIIKRFLEQLPSYFHTYIQFQPSVSKSIFTECSNFQHSSRITQILSLDVDIDILFKNLGTDVKRNIKKANNQSKIIYSDDFDSFLTLNDKVFERQKISNPIPLSIWHRLEPVLKEKKQRTIFLSQDAQNDIHGALYLIHDDTISYILASGSTELGRQYGVMSQLMWAAIEYSHNRFQKIDFLGSMLPHVANFNSRFNAEKVPYLCINQSKNKAVDWILTVLNKR